jgi:AraC-like DNA-binding protein
LQSHKFNLDKEWPLLFKTLDISAQEVLRYANLPLDLFLRKTPAVTAHEYYRFWDGLAHATRNEPDFALQLCRIVSANTIAPAIIAFLSSSNLNVALKRIAHYKPVVAPVHMIVEQNERHTSLVISGVSPDRSLPSLFILFELIFWLELARTATAEHLIPETVHSKIGIPHLDQYETFIGTRIEPDDLNCLTFSAADARKPFLTVNHAMWEMLEPAFNKRMEDLNQNATFRERVRACLLESISSGHYGMTHVAASLAISSRTLQRRLQDEGTTFQKVLDELRKELARHYLSATDYSSAEISFLLGYEEPNSFFRAFRTWTGQTPEIVRANNI